jgi:hypothetical protein
MLPAYPYTLQAQGGGFSTQGKQFFFEKKNQKTFICYGQHFVEGFERTLRAMSKSFLLLFFKKEELPFCYSGRLRGAPQ